MKNKHISILYGIAILACLFNAYLAYVDGNSSAAMAWTVASGFSAGAAGAYMKLTEDEDA